MFLVVGSGKGHLKTVFDCVLLNLTGAKLLPPEQLLGGYRWSSWPEYLKAPGKTWIWLRVVRLLGEHRIRSDSAPWRRAREQAGAARRNAELKANK